MERTRYAEIIKNILSVHPLFVHQPLAPSRETVRVFDDVNGHYLLVALGWQGQSRIYNTLVHIRLVEGKIWIEEDWTEEGIADDLLKAGVPKEDVVLALQHPAMRPYTDFAVA